VLACFVCGRCTVGVCVSIRYKFVGAEKVTEYIKSIPRGMKAPVMRTIATYIIGDSNHELKHAPAYRHVTRKAAYGKVSDAPAGYFSWAQFRFVMAGLKNGTIKIGRQHTPTNYNESFEIKNDSHWDRVEITGRMPFDRFPARINRMINWRHYTEVISTNIKNALRAGQAALNAWLKTKK